MYMAYVTRVMNILIERCSVKGEDKLRLRMNIVVSTSVDVTLSCWQLMADSIIASFHCEYLVNTETRRRENPCNFTFVEHEVIVIMDL
jgi:hypothetical protein